MKPIFAAPLLLALATGIFLPAMVEAAPSFDCARVTSAINRMICASPALSAADRKLADDFNDVRGQPAFDAKQLQGEEDKWLREVRGKCADADCLAKVYAARDAAILEMSQRAASPAAYDETRPFPVRAELWAAAQGLIGRGCVRAMADSGKAFPGFESIKTWLPVLSKGRFVLALQRGGTRFAFLLEEPGAGHCRIADVVTLPAPRPREAFLQCSLPAAQAYGFGIRQDGNAKPVGFWSMQPAKLVREPLDVLGGKVICHQPETGE